VNRQFESKYDPTIEDRYQKVVDHNNQPCVLEVWIVVSSVLLRSLAEFLDFRHCWTRNFFRYYHCSLAPSSRYSLLAMRELYMKNGEGFVLVYSVTSQKSLDDLEPIRNGIVRHKGAADVCRIYSCVVFSNQGPHDRCWK
jgi:GTPase SAR1 family protein